MGVEVPVQQRKAWRLARRTGSSCSGAYIIRPPPRPSPDSLFARRLATSKFPASSEKKTRTVVSGQEAAPARTIAASLFPCADAGPLRVVAAHDDAVHPHRDKRGLRPAQGQGQEAAQARQPRGRDADGGGRVEPVSVSCSPFWKRRTRSGVGCLSADD